jgi:hypothetical protein
VLKSLTREVTLTIQAKSGINLVVVVWIAIAILAAVTTFIFLCVSGFSWLAQHYGGAFAGLLMAGLFVSITIIASIVIALIRRRVRARAILARAAKAHAPSWLLDPRFISVAVQAGRTLGWQRLVPVALLGFMAAQWAREYRNHQHNNDHVGG